MGVQSPSTEPTLRSTSMTKSMWLNHSRPMSLRREALPSKEIPWPTPVREVIHPDIEPVQSGCPHMSHRDPQKRFRLDKSYSPK